MKFLALLATAAVATARTLPNPFSPIPGYPIGVGCLSDNQANFIVKNFVGMLTNTNRNQTLATAKVSIADSYSELSDSINTLEFDPPGTVTFSSKEAYIASLVAAPPIPSFITYDVFHDCKQIAWRWSMPNLGAGIKPIRGMNHFQVDPKTGQIKVLFLEFDTMAWGKNTGWKSTSPSGQSI